MADEKDELVPQKQSLFDVTADDILDNALRNLDEKQSRDVTKKAADEVVRIAVEKRMAEHRAEAAQEEMRNLVHNANLLDQRGGDYEINSTFETATGTTQVQIRRSKSASGLLIAAAIGLVILLIILITLIIRA
ncbi:MAG TPA: hypothetical protein VN256_20410 [Pyrinomonadaceae bacterium]|nr:hypothetical protein [Pyrinomonadaceae bacterium]